MIQNGNIDWDTIPSALSETVLVLSFYPFALNRVLRENREQAFRVFYRYTECLYYFVIWLVSQLKF